MLLHKLLKAIREGFDKYCRKIYQFERRRYYWSVDNSLKALQFLGNCDDCDHLLSADFSALYTKLPHNVVLTSLELIVKTVLQEERSIKTNGFRTFVSKIDYDGYRSFDTRETMMLISDVLKETYVSFAGAIFKQVIGIPMGGNEALR